jgi:hypothetical protein
LQRWFRLHCYCTPILLGAATIDGWQTAGATVIQELKTVVILVSAALAALFVHHVLDQAQAAGSSAGHFAP